MNLCTLVARGVADRHVVESEILRQPNRPLRSEGRRSIAV